MWEMQAKQIAHYHHDWSPSREGGAPAPLTRAGACDCGATGLYLRHADQAHHRWLGAPYKEYVTFERDAPVAPDYVKSDINAIRNARVADLREDTTPCTRHRRRMSG